MRLKYLISTLLCLNLPIEAFSITSKLTTKQLHHLHSSPTRKSSNKNNNKSQITTSTDILSIQTTPSYLTLPRGGSTTSITTSKTSKNLPLSVYLSSLPSLLHGYDTGVIAGALLYLVPALGLQNSPGLVGLMVTACTLGAIVGSVIVNFLLNRFGRIGTLRLGSWVFLISSILSGLSPNYTSLVLARFLAGIAMGTSSATVPVYISETSPSTTRGKAATVPQFMISSGILLSYAVDLVILAVWGGRWRVMLGAAVMPSIAMMIGVHTLHESPRYLASKGKMDEGLENLKKIRGTGDVQEEWKDIVGGLKEGEKETADPKASLSDLLSNRAARSKLMVMVALQAFQQLCGINAIVYFTPLILREAGVSSILSKLVSDSNAASMLSTIVAYAPKIPALVLAGKLMDKMGRKKLLTTFTPVMGLSLITLASSFRFLAPGSRLRGALAVLSVMTYGVVFCLSLGPVPSILSSESFPGKFRSAGMAGSVAAQWTFNAGVSLMFPVMQAKIGTENVLWMFAGMCALATAFSSTFVEETKGRKLEDIGGAKNE